MQKPYLIYKLTCIVLVATALQSCHKENGIDNENVVKTPYGLYVADQQGSLYNLYTNNKDTFKIIFPPDGYSPRAIITSGENILWVKHNTFLSLNNGVNFNVTDTTVADSARWQSVILDVPSHNKIYLGTDSTYGIKVSSDHGKTWKVDDLWDLNMSNPQGNHVTSFAQLKNGILFAHDCTGKKIYKRNSTSDRWVEVTMNNLPTTSTTFYLSHINNILLLADYKGTEGLWHSEDNGDHWNKYTGLPIRPLYSVTAPFNETLLVGTDSNGVYRLLGNSFVPSNNGLNAFAVVGGIVGKETIYKNDKDVRYYYVSTNKGLYRSIDQGQNWILVSPGNYTALY